LRADIAAKTDRRIRLLGETGSQPHVAQVSKELDVLSKEYQDVEAQIRKKNPLYAALTQPQPVTVKDVQQLLDPKTLLLEYVLGSENSYVFIVAMDSLTVHALPNRVEIEEAARQLRQALSGAPSSGERSQKSAILKLSRMILGPVVGQSRGKRLVIVGDGALEYIPFAVLRATDAGFPLLAEHEIVSLPSASVLALLRRERLNRSQPPKAVAVLADPVFDAKDARLVEALHEEVGGLLQAHSANAAVSNAKRGSDLPSAELPYRFTRSAADLGFDRRGEFSLPRLQYTRREALAIKRASPAGQAMLALDFDASREAAKSPDLRQYRIVHFATHGFLDTKHPELSGLVFSLVNKQGKAQNGFLDLEDIYNLNLPADLVVLSSCQSGLGKEIHGEGLIGLTRGFMYAGASSVIASLWDVDDVATAELMGRMYREIEQHGLTPPAALRQAQLQMWRQRRWSNPYFWAGFELEGEWK
jgi:CHAT domain-containing protein